MVGSEFSQFPCSPPHQKKKQGSPAQLQVVNLDSAALFDASKKFYTWQFFVTFLGWLSDPFKGLSDLQFGDEKVTLNHLAHWYSPLSCGWLHGDKITIWYNPSKITQQNESKVTKQFLRVKNFEVSKSNHSTKINLIFLRCRLPVFGYHHFNYYSIEQCQNQTLCFATKKKRRIQSTTYECMHI